MKTLLTIIGTACLLAFSILAQAGPPVPLNVGWTDPNVPAMPTAYVYTNNVGTTNGAGLYATVSGNTNATILFGTPSTTYVFVRLGDANSSPTNYTAQSAESNIIRIRVSGNGQVKVNTP